MESSKREEKKLREDLDQQWSQNPTREADSLPLPHQIVQSEWSNLTILYDLRRLQACLRPRQSRDRYKNVANTQYMMLFIDPCCTPTAQEARDVCVTADVQCKLVQGISGALIKISQLQLGNIVDTSSFLL